MVNQIIQHSGKVNPAYLYIATLQSRQSKRVMRSALRRIIRLIAPPDAIIDEFNFEWSRLQVEHIIAIRERLMNSDLSPNTINLTVSALRGVLKQMWLIEIVSESIYQKMIIAAKNVKGSRVGGKGKQLEKKAVRSVLDGCSGSVIGVRDATIILLLATSGMRVNELSSINVEDIDDDSLVILGKGNKERKVFISQQMRQQLNTWLSYRGYKQGALFVSVRKNGAISTNRITPDAIRKMLNKRFEAIGYSASPHDFRRTLVGNLLSEGVDMSIIARITGHESFDMIKTYDRRSEDQQKGVIESMPEI